MKKFYLIFFIWVLLPLITTAQEKPSIKQNQVSAQNTPIVAKPAAPIRNTATKVKAPKNISTVNAEKSVRIKAARARRRRLSTTTIYGNEWINYSGSQKYYKIKVAKDGLYHVDSAILAKAGIPVNSINPANYQIYFRGQEQYIYVRSTTSALSEKNGDYIEFYGQHNDGVLDSTLYYNINFVPNPYYSLFNDTSTYYLTWNSSIANHRMVDKPDTLWSLYPVTPYVTETTCSYWTATPSRNYYFPGSFVYDGAFSPNDPRYVQNSAWTENWISYNSGDTIFPDINKPYIQPGAPDVFLRMVELGKDTGNCTFSITSTARSLWTNVPCPGFSTSDLTTTFPATDLNFAGFNIKCYNNALYPSNIITHTYVFLNYPHQTDLDGDSASLMQVPYISSGGTQIDFTNIKTKSSSDSIRLYDLTLHNRMWVKPTVGMFKVNVPMTTGPDQCYLSTDHSVRMVTKLTPVGFNHDGLFTNLSTGPDSAYLIVTHASLDSSAVLYAAYRKKRFNTVLINVDELYDQFGYGVYYSPLGIRRFCNYAIDKWPKQPSNLLLMGKGINSFQYRANYLPGAQTEALVPTYGYPASDVLFTNNMGGDTLVEPAIPTGRLAALSNNEVVTYLNKVETFESTPAALWMKNVAHFVGGDDYNFWLILSNYMNNFTDTISDTIFGAYVHTFNKRSPAPITSTLTDSVINLISSGVSIMNFFGHAGGSDWDESIDAPSFYNNYGKYPFIIANACFSGDISEPIGSSVSSVSEQWVLQPPGAIAFYASDYLGIPGDLASYTSWLYADIAHRPFFGHPLGQIIQNTIERWQSASDHFMTETCLEMTYHGDPAIGINSMDSLPDYAVNNQSIYFTPSNVNVLLDSFQVHIIVSNYGATIPNQPISVTLTRYFPNGNSITYPPFHFNHVYYQDTAVITLPVDAINGPGLNYFTASVDLPPLWKELTLANNSIPKPGVPLYISSEEITPVWPYDFAIIPDDTVTLKASTNDPFAPTETYIFEIDTSHSFNSPVFQSLLVTNSGGVIEATPFDNWGTMHYLVPERHSPNTLTAGKTDIDLKQTGGNNKGFTSTAPKAGNPVNTVQENMLAKPILQNSTKPLLQPQPQTPALGYHPGQAKILQEPKDNFSMEKSRFHLPLRMKLFYDTVVYYWRVRRDTADTVRHPWFYSSFQYIKNRNGWGQSDYYQYVNDEQFLNTYNFIQYNNRPRDWTFNVNGHTLECFTYGMLANNLNTTNLYATEYKIDDFIQAYAGCQANYQIEVAVIDPITLIPWSTQYDSGFGNINDFAGSVAQNCTYPDNKFIFWANDPNQMKGLFNMLKMLSTKTNYYVLAWTWINGEYKWMGDSLVNEFAKLGATQMPAHMITPGLDSVPFIFFTQIGNPSSVIQKFGTDDTSALSISTVLKSNGTYGAITSPLIGPASRYDSLSWHQHSYERSLTDSSRLNILGITTTGTVQTLQKGVSPAVASMYISSINASLYPYIQLQLYTKDAINHTPGQMNWWRVFYQPVPEIAMNPNIYTYYHNDTLQYGDTLRFKTVVQNISDWPIDSTKLLTWITNSTNNVTYFSKPNTNSLVKRLNPGDTAMVSMWMANPTQSKNALNSIWFEVNPENYPDTRLEQFHFNDFAHKSFYSYGDKINPVLDVTFDGLHILNNDIVSPQPNILITFMDENKYLPLNDPSKFKVSLRDVTTNSPITAIPYGPQLSFTPAVMPHNKCSLLYTPKLADGTYELTVQGTDIAGNVSAINSYKIDFDVINKSMISEVLNYPNPFTTSTRFVFILTGDQLPTTFKIQIMTVTGKIVREINESEIGPIHIGRNITQYAWDGTDQYGNKLANGVYLYRVISSINGNSIDDYQTGADQYFTKSWGKMYLMR